MMSHLALLFDRRGHGGEIAAVKREIDQSFFIHIYLFKAPFKIHIVPCFKLI